MIEKKAIIDCMVLSDLILKKTDALEEDIRKHTEVVKQGETKLLEQIEEIRWMRRHLDNDLQVIKTNSMLWGSDFNTKEFREIIKEM